MTIPAADYDERLDPLFAAERALLGHDVPWFDAHTHIGRHDPDGNRATAADILGGLDRAGHERALVFAMHEPETYGAANDAVLDAVAASGGRLHALARVSPHAEDAVAEAARCIAAGAHGIKLHPRSEGFALDHPAVEQLVALAAEQRLIVLFHAGRGIPNLGSAVLDLARRHPDATLILAHAGISDLSWIADEVARTPNVLFDTAWWQIADLLTLFTTIAPGQIVYASDMPYGPAPLSAFLFARTARAAGLPADVVAEMAGGQLARVIAGERPMALGPPPGSAALGPRDLTLERVVSYLTAAVETALYGADTTEALSLARLACRADGRAGELLQGVDALIAWAQDAQRADAGIPRGVVTATLAALAIAGTPTAGAPSTNGRSD